MLLVEGRGMGRGGVRDASSIDEVRGDPMAGFAKSGGNGFIQDPWWDVARGSDGFRVGVRHLGLGVGEACVGVRRDVDIAMGPSGGKECGVNVFEEMGDGLVHFQELGRFLRVGEGLEL